MLLIFVSLTGCHYPSKQQAKDACEEWRNKKRAVTIISYRDEQSAKGVNRQKELEQTLKEIEEEDLSAYRDADRFRLETKAFQIRFHESLAEEDKKSREMIEHKVTARWCRKDGTNSQYLGYENRAVINKTWQNKQGSKGRGEITKHFRY